MQVALSGIALLVRLLQLLVHRRVLLFVHLLAVVQLREPVLQPLDLTVALHERLLGHRELVRLGIAEGLRDQPPVLILGGLLLAQERLDLRLLLLQVVVQHAAAVILLLQARILHALVADDTIEILHLREHLVVVVTQRVEARLEVIESLLQHGKLGRAVLEVTPHLHQLRALVSTASGQRRRRRTDRARRQCRARPILLLLQLKDLPFLVLQHLKQRICPVVCGMAIDSRDVAGAKGRWDRLNDGRQGRAGSSRGRDGTQCRPPGCR